ncbi:MAG: PadR family transcriptional regulator [Rhodoglobus sp.]
MGNVILGLLLLSPSTLYGLNKQFEAGVSLFYSASLGSIRSALLALLSKKQVTVKDSVENGRNKKTYSITQSGQAAFAEWMLAPITSGDLETVALAKLFMLGLLPPEERRVVLEGIIARIHADEQGLEHAAGELDSMRLPPEYREIFRFQRLTLDYGLQSHRNGRTFFEEALRRVNSLAD